ncbi:MAG: recombinase family protein [Candidatus Moraniibacteriota bacterium]
MENAVGYIRVSSEKQDYERQRDEIIQYAAKNNFTVVKFFEDKHSGSDYDERRGFQELLTFLDENSHIKIVIFDEISRMGRDTAMQVTTYKALSKKGIRIFTRGKGEFGSNKEDNLLFTVLSAIADYEKQTIIDRTSSGRRKVVRDGFTQISRRPYGYNLVLTVKQNRQVIKRQSIEVNKEEAEVVKRMFEIVAKNGTSFDALKYLSNSKVKPPKGKKWGKSTVLRILHNTTYYGEWRFGKYVKNHKTRYSLVKRKEEDLTIVNVPAIISKTLFDVVQEKLSKNKTSFNPRNSKSTFLLQGMLRCACGKLMQCYTEARTKERIYRCPQRNIAGVSEKTCQIHSFKADFIERIFLQEVKERIGDKEFLKEEKLKKLTTLKEPLNRLEKELDSTKESYESDIINLKQYYEKSVILQSSDPDKARIFEGLADNLLEKTKGHKETIGKLGEEIKKLKEKSIDYSSFKDLKKALAYITQKDIEEYDESAFDKKVKLARTYLKEVGVRFLDEETEKLQRGVLELRSRGVYKKGNEGYRKLYFSVVNKEHTLRRSAAIVVGFEVNFVNNYQLLVKFPYLHDQPELLQNYAKEGGNMTMIPQNS